MKTHNRVDSVSAALEHTFETTDCSNEVFAWCKPKNGKRFFEEATKLGLLRTEWCVEVDGDGFTVQPERYGTGYQLTNAGYDALQAWQPEAFTTRRFGT